MISVPAISGWTEEIPPDEWKVYRPVLEAMITRGPLMALGGGLAYSYYTSRWRNTKDIDVYVRPSDRPAAIELLTEHGFTDYYDQIPYDTNWIYRGYRDGLIIDIIWQMANYRCEVDDEWLVKGPQIPVCDLTVRVLPLEELILAKLYVMQRERCDWPDLLNVLYASGSMVDWDRLLDRVQEDTTLLLGLLHVFVWLCPERKAQIPEKLWELPLIDMREPAPQCPNGRRIRLLDSRPWFVGSLETPEDTNTRLEA